MKEIETLTRWQIRMPMGLVIYSPTPTETPKPKDLTTSTHSPKEISMDLHSATRSEIHSQRLKPKDSAMHLETTTAKENEMDLLTPMQKQTDSVTPMDLPRQKHLLMAIAILIQMHLDSDSPMGLQNEMDFQQTDSLMGLEMAKQMETHSRFHSLKDSAIQMGIDSLILIRKEKAKQMDLDLQKRKQMATMKQMEIPMDFHLHLEINCATEKRWRSRWPKETGLR